jgi:hypothetical protein
MFTIGWSDYEYFRQPFLKKRGAGKLHSMTLIYILIISAVKQLSGLSLIAAKSRDDGGRCHG